MLRSSLRVSFPIAALCLLLLSGCGGSGVPITGTVTKGGSAYQPAQGEKLVIMLNPEGDAGRQFSGDVQEDGTFSIEGPDRNGVPPGKYNISIMHYRQGAKGPPSAVRTGQSWDVSADQKKFTLDLGKAKS